MYKIYSVIFSAALSAFFNSSAYAETLQLALVKAYLNNPTLQAQRAALRAAHETAPEALSAFRPNISALGDFSFEHRKGPRVVSSSQNTTPYGVGLSISQTIFQGFQGVNGVKSAEANIQAARETLRNTEQNILLEAVQAYMDVVRDQKIYNLRQQNIAFLQEELRAAKIRFQAGEGTQTDISQSKARLALAHSQLALSQVNLLSSQAIYRQIIGHNPENLEDVSPQLTSKLPSSVKQALNTGLNEHPAILATGHFVQSALFASKIERGKLLPNVNLTLQANRRWEESRTISTQNDISVTGRISIPIYQAGQTSSRIRRSNEVITQRKMEQDSAREQVRASISASYGRIKATQSALKASKDQIRAAALTLASIKEEQNFGQRTMLDVLDAQSELIQARIIEYSTRRDYHVAQYSLLSAIGGLSARNLKLSVSLYDEIKHYRKTRDKWYGFRTVAK